MSEGRLPLRKLGTGKLPGLDSKASLYMLGECRVIITRDNIGDSKIIVGDARWHLSISHENRYPTWDEIVEARSRLLPEELHFVMGLPPADLWLSMHPNCFHLWELRDSILIEAWEMEGRMVQGSSSAGHKPQGT